MAAMAVTCKRENTTRFRWDLDTDLKAVGWQHVSDAVSPFNKNPPWFTDRVSPADLCQVGTPGETIKVGMNDSRWPCGVQRVSANSMQMNEPKCWADDQRWMNTTRAASEWSAVSDGTSVATVLASEAWGIKHMQKTLGLQRCRRAIYPDSY